MIGKEHSGYRRRGQRPAKDGVPETALRIAKSIMRGNHNIMIFFIYLFSIDAVAAPQNADVLFPATNCFHRVGAEVEQKESKRDAKSNAGYPAIDIAHAPMRNKQGSVPTKFCLTPSKGESR